MLNPHKLWWQSDKNDAHAHIFAAVQQIHQESDNRREVNLRSMRLYGNTDVSGVAPYSFTRSVTPNLPENRVKINVISSMADTVSAKISKMKPRVTFLTSGGDWASQQNAKALSKFMLGAFYGNNIYKMHQDAFKDCTVLDVGALKHFIQGNKIVTERVLATELYVDMVDSLYGTPKSLYQVKYVHKEVLQKLYPKKIAAIKMAAGNFKDMVLTDEEKEHYALVIEAWHLPSIEGAKDGRHVICLDNETLIDEPYKKDYFPFTFFRWSSRLVGFWGQSLTERLTGNQIEINKMLRIIQKSFHLGSAFKVFLEHGSRVAKEHINNDIGSIVYYTGQKPDFHVPQTVHPEYFRHLEFLIQSSYEEAGISQLSASSRKPAGIESGRALREYNEIETERFALTSQAYEQSFLDTARIYIELMKDMEELGVDYEVVAESKRFIEKIKWSDIDLQGNEYVMQMFPTSMLPHTPAGRLQFVQELVNENFIPKEFGLKLLDFPDLESYASLATSSIDDLLNTLDQILIHNKYQTPEPYQDLATGIKMFQSAYLRAKTEEVPEDRLEKIRVWIASAEALLAQAQIASQPPPTEAAPPTEGEVPPEMVAPPPMA